MESVTTEPGDLIEHVAAGMIVEEDASGGISSEKPLLEFLGEEERAGDGDRLMFLTGAGVDDL